MYPTITVRATKDFTVGPNGYIAIYEGEVRKVSVDRNGNFWTKTREGSLFGSCQVGRGWEIVKEEK